MSNPHRNSQDFPPTRWTLVQRAAENGDAEAFKALSSLCEDYCRPLLAVILSRGYSPADSDDLLQRFSLQLISREKFGRVLSDGLKLRAFLLQELKTFLIDYYRYTAAAKRDVRKIEPLDDPECLATDSQATDWSVPELEYERCWRKALITQSIKALGEVWENRRKNKTELPAFAELYPLLGYITDTTDKTVGSVADRLGINVNTLKTHLLELRSELKNQIQFQVAQTLVNPTSEAIEAEIKFLRTEHFQDNEFTLRAPDLQEVWLSMKSFPRLAQFIEGGEGFEHKSADDPSLPKGTILMSDTHVDGMEAGFAEWSDDQLTHRLPRFRFLNLQPEVIRPRSVKRFGRESGTPQILLNYGRVSRTAWCLQALNDEVGYPVTSRFSVWRPIDSTSPLVLWAILNSPIANAFTYCHFATRDVRISAVKDIPVFDLKKVDCGRLLKLVQLYFEKANTVGVLNKRKNEFIGEEPQLHLRLTDDGSVTEGEADALKYLHWKIDAEVLRLYELDANVERCILDVFTGLRRRGVPFSQVGYFPRHFTRLKRLCDLLAITADWAKTNKRRCDLIRKDVRERLSELDNRELLHLEELADARIEWVKLQMPPDQDEVAATVARLKAEGRWVQ